MRDKVRYICFDCGETTAAPFAVWRTVSSGRIFAYVHRGGQGCHKGMSSDEVRGVR